jgi:hypothetical protein
VILVDTSVWVDHFRDGDAPLAALLDRGQVLGHPVIAGEIALGNLRQRDVIVGALRELPQAIVASPEEILHFIEHQALFGRGIGYVDVHLLAAAQLTSGALLWTRDRRLHAAAAALGVAMGAAGE